MPSKTKYLHLLDNNSCTSQKSCLLVLDIVINAISRPSLFFYVKKTKTPYTKLIYNVFYFILRFSSIVNSRFLVINLLNKLGRKKTTDAKLIQYGFYYVDPIKNTQFKSF